MNPGILSGAAEAFRERPSETAVIEDSRSWSWTDFREEVERIAGELEPDAGRGPVFIHCPSGSEYLGTFFAASMAGRPACTLHQDWAGPELEAAIADASGFQVDPDAIDPDPVFYIGFTSGTSGRPKPFARRQQSWISSFEPAGDLFSVTKGDRVFLPGSLQHSHFLFGAVFALNRGASIRMYERFDPQLLAGELHEGSKAVLYLVPTMLLALDELGTGPLEGVHSVVVSGAKMEPHHWKMARRLFPGALIGELYGASELSFVTVNTGGEAPEDPGFVGRPFPGVEIEIRSPENETQKGPGVVFVRSPYLFEGYLEGTEINSPVEPDGFMTVGDMGTFAGNGLSLSGRVSNLIITGSKNVHPEEIEARISDHPAVRTSLVVGVPHPRWGEEIVAFMVPAGVDAEPGVDSLREHLKKSLASYKVPKRWFLVEEMPLTRAGKTDRDPDRLFHGAIQIT